jgi:two-component system, sensor histidine kinase PdtaS
MKFWAAALFVMLHFHATGQSMPPEYRRALAKFQESREDTNKVILLLRMDSIYLYRLSDTKQVLDSALLLAQQALALSEQLHFKQGIEDASFRIANVYTEKMDFNSAIARMERAEGVLRIRILKMLGERYLYRLGKRVQHLDSAYIFISQAHELSTLYSPKWQYETLCLLGKYFFCKGEIERGTQCFMKIIGDQRRRRDIQREAFWWSELGLYLPRSAANYADKIRYFNTAVRLYQEVGVRNHGLWIEIGLVHEDENEIALAETAYLEGIKESKSEPDEEVYHLYSSLARINAIRGDYQKTIYYSLEAIQKLDSIGETSESSMIYYTLADTYRVLEETAKSIYWYKRALDQLALRYEQYRFPIAGQIVRGLIRQGKGQEAMNFLTDFLHMYQPVSILDRQVTAAAKGDCNNAMGKFRSAEKSYLEMIAWGKEIPPAYQTGSGIVGRFIQGAEAYYTMGKFYVEQHRHDEAYPFFVQALAAEYYPPSLSMRRDIHMMLFMIDRAKGNLASAIRHFEIHKRLNDSIFSESKVKQIEELKIKYETAQHETALALLQSKEQLQEEELKQANQNRNYTYVLLGILILLIAVGYSRYSLKIRTNNQLHKSQQEIDQQNKKLMSLLSDQQKLVTEKEWLIKEIHHRVKNNFHMVTGLLGTQSQYLKNEEALAAIQNSKHRIHAMSLLHQRLYQSENLSEIQMPDYIYELVSNLQQSFETTQQVLFDLQIEPINLDPAQALPLGLILNEAVTNSIKYAFPTQSQGDMISISLKHVSENSIALTVEDNGIGIPDDINTHEVASMGLNLMRGLTEDIEGIFVLEKTTGTGISIIFPYNDHASSALA